MSSLKRSDITIENYAEIYAYYRQYEIDKRFTKAVHAVLSQVYHPEVTFSEGTQEFIESQRDQGKPVILAANHVRYIDHNVAAAALSRTPDVTHFVGNTFVLAKAEYFQSARDRWHTERVGCVPVFRSQDVPRDQHMLVGRAASELVKMSVEKLSQGLNLFCFPEGTRNKGDRITGAWEAIQPVEAGIGHIATKAWRSGVDVGIVPVGIAYGASSRLDWRSPAVHFGVPIESGTDGLKPADVTSLLGFQLQQSVDEANADVSKTHLDLFA